MPNTKFNQIVNQVRCLVAEATGLSTSSGKVGGDSELINALVESSSRLGTA